MAQQTVTLNADSNRTYGFDFYLWAEIQSGDTIVSATVTSNPTGPTIGSPSVVTSSNDATKLAAQVNCQIHGWTAGTPCHIEVKATTASGEVLPGCVIFNPQAC